MKKKILESTVKLMNISMENWCTDLFFMNVLFSSCSMEMETSVRRPVGKKPNHYEGL